MSQLGDEQPPTTPELCMQTIHDYALDKFSKVNAIRAIFAAFYESAEYQATPTNEVDAAIGTYLTMFDQHNSSCQISAKRGTRYIQRSESEHEDEDPARKDGPERLRTQSPKIGRIQTPLLVMPCDLHNKRL